MAEHKGFCECPDCGQEARVMSDKREFLYLVCGECGVFKYQTHAGQARLKARFERYQSKNEPETIDGPVQEPRSEPETVSVVSPKKRTNPFFKKAG